MGEKLIIAIQGERGSYSEQAASQLLGPEIEVSCCEYFEEVFQRTTNKDVAFCLIPIENSLSGSIHKNYDLLLEIYLNLQSFLFLRRNKYSFLFLFLYRNQCSRYFLHHLLLI